MAEPATDFTLDTAQVLAEEEHGASIVGRSPWYLAWRRLRRNYIAFIALFVFVVIAVACSLAPIYAHHIAHTAPNATHTEDIVNGTRANSSEDSCSKSVAISVPSRSTYRGGSGAGLGWTVE